ncbi:MAG: patatin-like phospholipase family protein [Deltaproteobacteria bacterium]|nr:patatin-like phospholipase family protein [Deltaproteobacteria bacterium]
MQSPEPSSSPFDAIVFAGGGARCFWQLGFWQAVQPELDLRPSQVAAVSAGATVACMIFADRAAEGLARFERATADNARNFYPGHVFRREPLFPHYDIYRRILAETLDARALSRLHAGPELRVLLARPPAYAGPYSGAWLGIAAYSLEKKLTRPMHPRLPACLGFEPEVVEVRDCETPAELSDLLLQSACTPPFVPPLWRHGRPVLDGGLVDNVPIVALSGRTERILVLLTRPHPQARVPDAPGRVYVQPSRPVPAGRWDYTDPEAIRATFDLGRRDGEDFVTRRCGGADP